MGQDNDDWKELVTDVDGFWDEDEQAVVQGKVASITEMELAGRSTSVAVLILTAECKAVTGSRKDKKTITLGIGEAIGVVLKHKLADIPSMADNQCEVRIEAKEKITLPNSNTMWRYGIRYRGRRATFAAARTPRQEPGPAPTPSSTSPEAAAEQSLKQF